MSTEFTPMQSGQTPGAPHSRLPWTLKPCQSRPDCWCAVVSSPVATVIGGGEIHKEDAALIVEAVNSYHALRAAAAELAEAAKDVQERTFVRCMHRGLYGDRPEDCARCQAMRRLGAAILAYDATTAQEKAE